MKYLKCFTKKPLSSNEVTIVKNCALSNRYSAPCSHKMEKILCEAIVFHTRKTCPDFMFLYEFYVILKNLTKKPEDKCEHELLDPCEVNIYKMRRLCEKTLDISVSQPWKFDNSTTFRIQTSRSTDITPGVRLRKSKKYIYNASLPVASYHFPYILAVVFNMYWR